MSFINENIKAARKKADLTQEEIASKLGVPRTTYAHWELNSDPDFEVIASIAKLCGYKFKDVIDEDFLKKHQLNENVPKYKTTRKPLSEVKIIDADKIVVKDLLQVKGMMRVMLRNQAHILAAQRRIPIASVLKEMTEAVKGEISDEFDEL